MKRATAKIFVVTITILFLGTTFGAFTTHPQSDLLNNYANLSPISFSSSSYSVHLFTNGNGWVVYSANYSVDGILNFHFDNDRSQNFSTNSVPSDTIFHLVSSPNSGYSFVNWTGSVKSTNNSIYVTVNQSINEEAIYEKTTSYSVKFTESGLPTGNSWYVNLSNGDKSGPVTGTSYTFSLTNGSYGYSVAVTNKTYSPAKSTGSFTVDGSQVSKLVTFSEVTYLIAFTESGLPTGTSWYLNLSNGGAFTSVSNSISFNEPNGTYSYTLATTNKSLSSTGGIFSVSGSSVIETVVFSPLKYNITFTESGLPTGEVWYVNITGGQSFMTSSTVLTLGLSNGTYEYSVSTKDKRYSPSSSTGTLLINGKEVSESVSFSEITYLVTIAETGLPTGTQWTLSFNGNQYTVTGATINEYVPNGSYSYSASSVNGYSVSYSPSSPLKVDGANVSALITYSANTIVKTYKVTIDEVGLKTGTQWILSFEGKQYTLTNSSYNFYLQNGSYSYSASSMGGYDQSYSPNFTVDGAPLTSQIKYTHTVNSELYEVSITESGLSANIPWTLTFNGSQYALSNTSYNFYVPNGSYNYSANTPYQYYATYSVATPIIVNGSSERINVTFSKTYGVFFLLLGDILSGSTWNITLSNGQSASSSTYYEYWFYLPNGTYSYNATVSTMYSPNELFGHFIVDGTNLQINLTFNLVSYNVNFTETGLPQGTNWQINATTTFSSGHSFTFYGDSNGFTNTVNVPNGTYFYTVFTNHKYFSLFPSSGSFTVKGKSISDAVNFEVGPVYSVTFTESGLPSGTPWTLTFNGQQYTLTNSSYNFYVPDGTYSYSASTVSGYSTTYSPSSPLTVNGSPITAHITYFAKTTSKTYNISFTESGLPAGTPWYVVLNGTNLSSTSSTITFSEVNGTYSFTTGTSASYIKSTTSRDVKVDGSSVNRTITFTANNNTSAKPPSSPNNTDYYVIGGIVTIAAVGSVSTVFLRRRKP